VVEEKEKIEHENINLSITCMKFHQKFMLF
jgi:hypothetical protein